MITVSLIVLVGLAAASALRRQSAAMRHWVLAVALACGAIAPAVGPLLPSWQVPLPTRVRQTAAAVESDVQIRIAAGAPVALQPQGNRQAPGPWPIWSWLRAIWIAGLCFNAASLAAGAGRLRWLASRSERLTGGAWIDRLEPLCRSYGIARPVAVLQSTHPTMLVTWGLLRPVILLPAAARGWSSDRIDVVLAHELAHIRRRDWVVQLLTEVVRSVYWMNPLVWMASRRLRRESELACDDEVLRLGIAAPTYAAHVVELARDASRQVLVRVPAQAIARPCNLERRVRAMLNAGLNRNRTSARARGLSAIVLTGLSLLIAGFAANAQSFASFSGTVSDPTKAPIANALVELTSTSSSAKYQVRTDGSGRFEFVGLPPGSYQYKAEVMGFKANRGEVSVSGRQVRRDLPLEIGSLSESITIVSTPESRSAPPAEMAFQARPPAPAVQECQPSSSGGNIKPPMKLRDVRPTYPPNPDGTVAGVVVLKARIASDGTVDQVDVVRSPHADLSRSASAAIEQWVFTPTLLNCVPIPVEMTATFHFASK